jgi:hypothetical protein
MDREEGRPGRRNELKVEVPDAVVTEKGFLATTFSRDCSYLWHELADGLLILQSILSVCRLNTECCALAHPAQQHDGREDRKPTSSR